LGSEIDTFLRAREQRDFNHLPMVSANAIVMMSEARHAMNF
jgi:hypothetical protein